MSSMIAFGDNFTFGKPLHVTPDSIQYAVLPHSMWRQSLPPVLTPRVRCLVRACVDGKRATDGD
jgi:hypothetical protein